MKDNLTNYKQYPKTRCIYRITNILTNKHYVGSTFNLKERISRHVNYLNRNCHHSWKLQESFTIHTIKNFIVEVLEDCEKMNNDELHNREIFYIKKFDSVINGFNCILNSKKYKKFKQTSNSISKQIKSRSIPVIGINITTKEKIYFESLSDAAKFINDQSTNITKCCKGVLRFVKNFVFVYNKDFDLNIDYTILKKRKYNRNSDSLLARGKSNKLSKKVYKYDLQGNFIKEYHSRSYCEKENNLKKECLRTIIPKQTPLGGFLYKNDKN
jgi:hypothetical protein